MKKLLILAVLSVALGAQAEDQFLYWMIGDGATLDGVALAANTYYAKVSTTDARAGEAGNYLNLFASPDESTYGTTFTASYNPTYGSWETFAGFASGTTIPGKFFVELYSDSGCGDLLGVADLDYVVANITGKGSMGHVDAAAASTFLSVPEPTSGMLLLLGVAGLALRRRKMQRA